MDRRQFLTTLTASAALAQTRASKPNILFILADDLGYGDLGCYGQKLIATPNIDKLASEGVRFTQFYCGSTVCAPSRCALMTGKHTGHARIRGNAKVDLLPEDVTVAEVLKDAGYHTGLVGKWGLGTAGRSGIPNRQGFDEFYGVLDQKHAHTQYPTQLWDNEDETFLDGNFGPARKDYTQELYTNHALKFLQDNKSRPFFLFLSYTTPHANNELTKQSGNGMEIPGDHPYSSKPWPKPDRDFAGVVDRLDRDVGAVLAKLRELGLDQNTIVMFASDNGPHREGGNNPEFFDSNGPVRGIKRDLYDGGIRTPFLVRWPGVTKAGSVSEEVCAFWDLLPTFAEIAGVKAPTGLDGMPVVAAIKGGKLPSRPYLYWEFHENGFSQAVRMGNWKGVRLKTRQAPIQLYDLTTDIGETKDVAASHPDIVKRIAEIFESARTDSKEFPIRERT
jgi:arylsulfatase A-like enzyme